MEEKLIAADEVGSFLGENAAYFTQLFQPVANALGSSGEMRLVSEEADYTVAVVAAPLDDGEELEVDCVILDPEQESLVDCFAALNKEEAE